MIRPNVTTCNSLLYLNSLRVSELVTHFPIGRVHDTLTLSDYDCSHSLLLCSSAPLPTYTWMILLWAVLYLQPFVVILAIKMPVRHVPLGFVSAAAKDGRHYSKIPTTHHKKTNQPPTHPLALKLSKLPWSYPPSTPYFTRAAHLPHPWVAKESTSVGRALAPHRLAPRWLHPSIHSSKGLVCVLSLTWYLWHVKVWSRYLHGGCVHHPGTPPYPSCPVSVLCLFS